MINKLQQARADLTYQRKIQTYIKPDLLILDELGYRSMAQSTVEDFFEIISHRHEKGSVIITSNRPVTESRRWPGHVCPQREFPLATD